MSDPSPDWPFGRTASGAPRPNLGNTITAIQRLGIRLIPTARGVCVRGVGGHAGADVYEQVRAAIRARLGFEAEKTDVHDALNALALAARGAR